MAALRHFLLLLVASVLLSGCTASEPRLSRILSEEASSFVDPTGSLTVEDLSARRDELFRPGDATVTRSGSPPFARTLFWLELDGRTLSSLVGPQWTEPLVLMLENTRLREVTLHLVKPTDARTQSWTKRNDHIKPGDRGFRYPVFLLDPNEFQGSRLFLSIRSEGPMRSSLRLVDFQTFAELYDGGTRTLALVIGVRAAIFAYILALALSLKSRTNLWLAGLIGVGLLQIAGDNALFEGLPFNGSAALARGVTLGELFAAHFCLVGFTTRFLRLHIRAPRVFPAATSLLGLLGVCILAAVIDGFWDAGGMRLTLPYIRVVVLVFLLAATIAAAPWGIKRSLGYMLACSPLVAAITLRILQDVAPDWRFATIPNDVTMIGITISISLFALLSSLDLRRREARLKANVEHNARRFRAFAELGTDASWEVDAYGRLSFIAGRPTPLPRLEVGDHFVEALERSATPDAAAPVRDAIARRLPFDDLRLRLGGARDRDSWISLSGRPIADEAFARIGGSIYRGLIRDVTEEVEREGRRLMEQQIFALGQLAGSVAHEINNLIHPVINLTKRLRTRPSMTGDAEGERMLGLIDLSSRQAAKVVSELLHTMRGDRGGDVARPLPQALEQALEALRPALPSSVRLDAAMEAEAGPMVRVGDMLQVLGNLVSNAVHAMDGNGTIRLTLATATGGAKLIVADDGRGMEERVRLRALQPFFSTKTDGQGTGIGLYIVQRIVGDYKGWVSIDSAPGEGTSVTIFIPYPEDRDDE